MNRSLAKSRMEKKRSFSGGDAVALIVVVAPSANIFPSPFH